MQLFSEEKTEESTPRRRQEARKKGQVVKSADLGSAANLLAMVLVFLASGQLMFDYFGLMLTRFLGMALQATEPANVEALLLTAMGDYFLLMSPAFLTAVLSGLAVNYLQVGFLFTAEPVTFKLERLNPVEGLKRVFSRRSLFELAKAVLKVTLVSLVAFLFIRSRLESLLTVQYLDAPGVWQKLSSLSLSLSLWIGVVFLTLALLDYLYQRYEHYKNLKMTKQEVKEEAKQMEGDPQLRARLRERRRRMVTQRMMQEVPRATVVITNPTELAVALRYREEEESAPVVVAKGAALMARRIRELAAEHGVPLVENKPVARLLYDQVEVGQEIPVELYQAVAEILAIVYSLRR
ncbi:MAG: flagellar biosynthesis protein FlhB [Dethiobacter sp.]|nr:flagellar biosynthesis protein FlhB [Dethiobacter sp.]